MTSAASSTPINVAVFGAGRIGRIHAANLARQPGVKLKYGVDVNGAAAAALAAQYGAQVADIDGAMGDASVGATLICSSTDTHADLIEQSAAQKKHVFCEKPVDLTVERARACAAAVERAGIVCMIGFQRRFDPTFAAVKARIDAGEIGAPEMLVVTSRDPGAPPVDYIKASGGIFKDMLIHDFDIFRWIRDDEAASAYGYDQRFEVLGARGMLQAGNHRPTEVIAATAASVALDKPEHFFLERY